MSKQSHIHCYATATVDGRWWGWALSLLVRGGASSSHRHHHQHMWRTTSATSDRAEVIRKWGTYCELECCTQKHINIKRMTGGGVYVVNQNVHVFECAHTCTCVLTEWPSTHCDAFSGAWLDGKLHVQLKHLPPPIHPLLCYTQFEDCALQIFFRERVFKLVGFILSFFSWIKQTLVKRNHNVHQYK